MPDQPRKDKQVLCFEGEKEAGVSTEIRESQGSRSLAFLIQIEEGGTGAPGISDGFMQRRLSDKNMQSALVDTY